MLGPSTWGPCSALGWSWYGSDPCNLIRTERYKLFLIINYKAGIWWHVQLKLSSRHFQVGIQVSKFQLQCSSIRFFTIVRKQLKREGCLQFRLTPLVSIQLAERDPSHSYYWVQQWAGYLELYMSNLKGVKPVICTDSWGKETEVVHCCPNTDVFLRPLLYYCLPKAVLWETLVRFCWRDAIQQSSWHLRSPVPAKALQYTLALSYCYKHYTVS